MRDPSRLNHCHRTLFDPNLYKIIVVDSAERAEGMLPGVEIRTYHLLSRPTNFS